MKHVKVVLRALIAFAASSAMASDQITQTPLPGTSIPRFVEPVPTFGPFGTVPRVQAGTGYTVEMNEFQQQVLPASFYTKLPNGFNAGTYVWGYKVNGAPQLYPGVTVEAQRGTPVTVTYLNNLIKPDGTPPVLQKYITVDQTVHWADPAKLMCQFFTVQEQVSMGCFLPFTGLVPAVVHLHGGEVPSAFDGGPDEWFTPNTNEI
jgi:spore coat protein A